MLLVGDERGSVISMKLSPNLRQDWCSATELAVSDSKMDKEMASMQKLLQSVDTKVVSKPA